MLKKQEKIYFIGVRNIISFPFELRVFFLHKPAYIFQNIRLINILSKLSHFDVG